MDFEQNLKNFRTCKNSDMRPLCTTNPENEPHGQKILSFDQFLPQISNFR
jgi:hypothetical protein